MEWIYVAGAWSVLEKMLRCRNAIGNVDEGSRLDVEDNDVGAVGGARDLAECR